MASYEKIFFFLLESILSLESSIEKLDATKENEREKTENPRKIRSIKKSVERKRKRKSEETAGTKVRGIVSCSRTGSKSQNFEADAKLLEAGIGKNAGGAVKKKGERKRTAWVHRKPCQVSELRRLVAIEGRTRLEVASASASYVGQ